VKGERDYEGEKGVKIDFINKYMKVWFYKNGWERDSRPILNSN